MKRENKEIPFKIHKAIQYIEENYRSPCLSLKEVATTVQMHRKSFSRLWNRTMEINITDFINDLRIKEAEKMLAETPMYISQTAYKVGFKPDYFCQVFKSKTGISPTEYRNSIILLSNR